MRYVLSYILFLFSICVYAQHKPNADSMRRLLSGHPQEDTTRVVLLNQLAWDISYQWLDSGLHYTAQAIQLAEALDYKSGLAEAYNTNGTIYADQGKYARSIEAHLIAIRLREELGLTERLAESYHNIALVYLSMNKTDSTRTGIDYQQKAYNTYHKIIHQDGLGPVCYSLGDAWMELDSLDKAKRFFLEGEQKAREYNYTHWICMNLSGRALCSAAEGDNASADSLIAEAFRIGSPVSNDYDIMALWISLSELRKAQARLDQGLAAADTALQIAHALGVTDKAMEIMKLKAEILEEKKDHAGALDHYRRYYSLRDSLLDIKNQENITELEAVFEKDKKEKELEMLRQSDNIQKIIVSGGIIAAVGFIVLALLLYGRIRMGIVAGRQLEEKKAIIEAKKKDITDSIHYARRIQNAVTPDENMLRQYFPGAFIYHRPKGIVSGDFWWYAESGEYIFIAAGDCSGHGVPGGFMSIMSASFLNGIVVENKTHDPGNILNELSAKVKLALRHEGSSETKLVTDTLDIALCRISKTRKEFSVAGAMMPVLLVNASSVREISVGSVPCGSDRTENASFKSTFISPAADDMIILCSDGIYQLTSGAKEKEEFRRHLLTLSGKSPAQITESISDYLKTRWDQPELPDDIIIVGLPCDNIFI